MKKITMLSVVAAAVLFVGCGEDSKKAASEASAKAVESTKEAASHAVDATKDAADKAVEAAKKAEVAAKEAADKAVEATKEAAKATKEAAVKAVDSAKVTADETVKTVTKAVTEATENVAGAAAYAKCAGCHGADGKTKALGKSPVIAGQTKEELVTKMNGYKAGTINVAGMGNLMQGQVATMDDTAIDAVATYISTMK